jgi:hypothetical protein
MFIVRNFLLFQTRALAQLDYSYVVSSKLRNRLKLMAAMRPGFLRAGRMAAWLFLFENEWHGTTNCLGFLFRRDNWRSKRLCKPATSI